MITADEIFLIGRFTKTHGIKGEIELAISNDVFAQGEYPFLICEIDGIFVPFFIETFRYKRSETGLVRFRDVENETRARRFEGLDVYLHRSLFDSSDMLTDEYSWNFFVGFTLQDMRLGVLGIVTDVDDDTANILFVVETPDGEELLVPANEELIVGFDEDSRLLQMDLPVGLVRDAEVC